MVRKTQDSKEIVIKRQFYQPLLALTKPIITLSVSFSALTGFILHAGSFAPGWFYMYIGVMFIAAGSAALNQIQEAGPDRLMERTRHRPIPSGQISTTQAGLWSTFLALAGTGILWFTTNPTATLLAIFTLIWYNGIYTPLKRTTPWAIIPGAIVGAIPPAIGWTAAGGALQHPHIIFVAFFFFIGQIPHFWLILLRHGHDYQKAGFPSIITTFTRNQVTRLTFSWTLATALAAVLLPIFGIITSPLLSAAVILFSLILVLSFARRAGFYKEQSVNRNFMIMNIYFLLIMLIIIADALFT